MFTCIDSSLSPALKRLLANPTLETVAAHVVPTKGFTLVTPWIVIMNGNYPQYDIPHCSHTRLYPGYTLDSYYKWELSKMWYSNVYSDITFTNMIQAVCLFPYQILRRAHAGYVISPCSQKYLDQGKLMILTLINHIIILWILSFSLHILKSLKFLTKAASALQCNISTLSTLFYAVQVNIDVSSKLVSVNNSN